MNDVVIRQTGISPEFINPHGGAIALGHAIGSSGCRILVTLVHSMVRNNAKRGVAALCVGGGEGVALSVYRSENQQHSLCTDEKTNRALP